MAKLKIILPSVLITLIICVSAFIIIEKENDTKSFLNYYSGSLECDNEFIDKLNNNDVDAEYVKRFNLANTPSEQAEVINKWNEQYEEELESVFTQIETLIENSCEDSELQSSSESFDEYKDCYAKYCQTYSEFLESYVSVTSGYGTGMHSEISFKVLNFNRNMLFTLLELQYKTNGEVSVFGQNYENENISD